MVTYAFYEVMNLEKEYPLTLTEAALAEAESSTFCWGNGDGQLMELYIICHQLQANHDLIIS